MLDEDTRNAVLKLHRAGQRKRAISRLLQISREAVTEIIKDGAVVPARRRSSSGLDSHQERIAELFRECKGSMVRVHERLRDEQVEVGYSRLTEYCRQRDISVKAKKPSGEDHFAPGQEMQHDTSPHRVVLGGHEVKMQCASLILCGCRMVYAQVFFRWSRLEARQFLSEAIVFFGGAAGHCMVDNSSVILAHGSGKSAVPAAECRAFGEHFGFIFIAHEVSDANRSARVEREFHHIENNFYPGRTFVDRDDCNAQLRLWCEEKNAQHRKHLHGSPRQLLAGELPFLKPLPVHVPEVYEPVSRMVDLYGTVTLHTNRYSAPAKLIGEQVQIREYKDKVRIYCGPRIVAEHPLLPPGQRGKHSLPEHRHPGAVPERQRRLLPIAEEVRLRAAHPELARYVDGVRARHSGRAVGALRRLLGIWQDYPQAAVLAAVAEAQHYGMYDLARLEKMVLRRVAGDVFGLDPIRDLQTSFDFEEFTDHDHD